MNTTSLPIVQLTVLGCGTLGSAIVDGLCNQLNPTRSYRPRLTGRRENHITQLKKKYPEAVVSIDNRDPRIWAPVEAATAHLVVIGTQPEFTKAVCTDIRDSVEAFCQGQTPIILTVCPGITTSQLESWLPAKSPIVRSMPNTPVAVGQGATALFANELVTAKAMDEIKLLLLSVSPCIEFLESEGLLDVVASVSGSGPAYIFYLAKEMVDAAVEKGLSEKQVTSLLIQSIIGAGFLAQSVPHSLLKHLNDVCVPGGSTEKAMATLDLCGANAAIQKAVHVSWEANKKMGKA